MSVRFKNPIFQVSMMSYANGLRKLGKVKLGFTGHRNKQAPADNLEEILHYFPDAIWIHGGSKFGFDRQVADFIDRHNLEYEMYRPDYTKYHPKIAPLRRNDIIVERCTILIACYDGRDTGGTNYTINEAEKINVPVFYTKYIDWPSSKACSSF